MQVAPQLCTSAETNSMYSTLLVVSYQTGKVTPRLLMRCIPRLPTIGKPYLISHQSVLISMAFGADSTLLSCISVPNDCRILSPTSNVKPCMAAPYLVVKSLVIDSPAQKVQFHISFSLQADFLASSPHISCQCENSRSGRQEVDGGALKCSCAAISTDSGSKDGR